MSNPTPPSNKLAQPLLTGQGLRRPRRCCPRRDNKISKDIHNLGAPAQAMCRLRAPLSSIFMAAFVVLHSNSATAQPLPHPRNAHWRFFAREIYHGHDKVIGTQDCPLEGCQTAIEIPLRPDSISTTTDPFLCFPYRNAGACLREASSYGGCRYRRCQIESAGRSGTMLANLNTHFQLSIGDPWHERWQTGVVGKLYPNSHAKAPVADLRVSRLLVPVSEPVTDQRVKDLQQKTHTRKQDQAAVSWLQYIQYTAGLLSLTTHRNASECFLCASLSQPPLTAIPVNISIHEPLGPSPPGKLENVPLFDLSFPLCLVSPSSRSHPSCSRDVTITGPVCVRPPALLWCNNVTSACINPPFPGFCTPVIVVPRVYLYEPQELPLQLGGDGKTREGFVPLLIRMGLRDSLGTTGDPRAAFVQMHHPAGDFQENFDQAMASSTIDSLDSLQPQVTSQAGDSLQNRRRRDLAAAEQGATCLFLGEECCFYVNKSGLVEQNIRKLKELQRELQEGSLTSRYSTPLAAWLVPLLVSTLVLGALLTGYLIKYQKTRNDR
ncbi:ERV-BabFcenv provirus ancestral Env polyprotein-like [Meriones unguiculatus]|uniref:ERV-BabFcenv provirus ancestral Env polyprotein-like n=1 Tax=Meriones unguiculatus TaxID=10047 RepID=UPI000B4F0255|nr:ERV-BabFcenv provirus ancestral Env polyprotein-like [Meriones unguiculatus]